ncbi:MAG TPA: hypothetical protein VGJ45_15890 [Pseudonocardiaceae bacterium]|jgi:hypothetical protein
MADAQDETPLEKAEEAVRHEVDEVEVATLMTVDEIKDTVHDAVEKVKGLGHHHDKSTD